MKNLFKLAFPVILCGLFVSCAPAQQNSSLPKANDVWGVKDSAGKLTRLSIQKVTVLNETYFLNADAEGKAAFIAVASLTRPSSSLSAFISASKPANELIAPDQAREQNGFLCQSEYVPGKTEFIGDTFIGNLSALQNASGLTSQGQCQIISPNLGGSVQETVSEQPTASQSNQNKKSDFRDIATHEARYVDSNGVNFAVGLFECERQKDETVDCEFAIKYLNSGSTLKSFDPKRFTARIKDGKIFKPNIMVVNNGQDAFEDVQTRKIEYDSTTGTGIYINFGIPKGINSIQDFDFDSNGVDGVLFKAVNIEIK
jgi:hypothetical protein